MRIYHNLYNKIISYDNLYLAERRARKGKSKRKEIIKYVDNLDENIWKLENELYNRVFSTSKYSHFVIYEPKKREISKLPYKDRVCHWAIINVIEPILKDSFISQTYSCIKGRGIHKGIEDLSRYLKNKENTRYCLKLDIKKFYKNINHNILKSFLKRRFKDKDLLDLFNNIIDSHKNGVPLGNLTSQWFANLYLNKFDHWLKENKKINYYLRYCDDLVILHSDKTYLHSLRREIELYLKNNLKLELSNYQVFLIESRGIDFLGYVNYPNYRKLRKSIKIKFVKAIRKGYSKQSIASRLGWLKHGDCRNLERKYLNQ